MKRVLMSDELFEHLGASRVEWGEPDADGFYTPTVYAEPRDDALLDVAELAAVLTERHLEAEGFCGESHMQEAVAIERRLRERAALQRSHR